MGKGKHLTHVNPKNDTLDPRQARLLTLYLDPKSATFANLLQSAVEAGFTESTARAISGKMPQWLSEQLDKSALVYKARRNLHRFLDLDDEDPQKLRVKADITKFVAERVDKENFSTRQELTGADGGAIKSDVNIDQRLAQITAELRDLDINANS